MAEKVFDLLLVAAVLVCINGIDPFYEERACQVTGGVCTYQKNCREHDHYKIRCFEQYTYGAICCSSRKVIDKGITTTERITETITESPINETEECYKRCDDDIYR